MGNRALKYTVICMAHYDGNTFFLVRVYKFFPVPTVFKLREAWLEQIRIPSHPGNYCKKISGHLSENIHQQMLKTSRKQSVELLLVSLQRF